MIDSTTQSANAKDSIVELPKNVKERLDTLVTELASILGDDLVSVIAHGSVVRGGWVDGVSDVDVVLVLKNASFERLQTIGNPLQIARYSARIEAMILEAGEIERAADAYPLLYDDIKDHHVVLYGGDPFATLTIADDHRRIRIEQELRECQIRLRRAVTDASGDVNQIAGAVSRKMKQVRSPLRALLRLKGAAFGGEAIDVLRSAATTYGCEAARMTRVHEAPAEAHAEFTRLLKLAIDDVDAMATPARS